MKRFLLTISICLFLGTITTVGVSWACVIWLSPYDGSNGTWTYPDNSGQGPRTYRKCSDSIVWMGFPNLQPGVKRVVAAVMMSGSADRRVFSLADEWLGVFRIAPDTLPAAMIKRCKNGSGRGYYGRTDNLDRSPQLYALLL